MKILLIYPKYPETFLGLQIRPQVHLQKSGLPPPGPVDRGGPTPETWEKRLIDLNVRNLKDEDLKGVDLVFIGAMFIQKDSVEEIIHRCEAQGVRS